MLEFVDIRHGRRNVLARIELAEGVTAAGLLESVRNGTAIIRPEKDVPAPKVEKANAEGEEEPKPAAKAKRKARR